MQNDQYEVILCNNIKDEDNLLDIAVKGCTEAQWSERQWHKNESRNVQYSEIFASYKDILRTFCFYNLTSVHDLNNLQEISYTTDSKNVC